MFQQLSRKKDISAIINESGKRNGGLRRNLNATNLVALGIGAIVGTGIFVITGTAAATYAGPALTISFIISALGCVMAGLCFAEFAAMIPVAGGVILTVMPHWAKVGHGLSVGYLSSNTCLPVQASLSGGRAI